MRVEEMNWMQMEQYLQDNDQAVLPLGSVEQHGYLSLATDVILAHRVSLEAAEPLGVPVFPPLAYGITPYFMAFPGTLTLRVGTYLQVIRDLLDALATAGFRRIVLVNGHGGNTPAASLAGEWMAENAGVTVVMHNWWNAPRTWEAVQRVDTLASHASWMESFPWNRVVQAPEGVKPMVELDRLRSFPPRGVRELLGDGNYGGAYQKPDEDMLAIWRIAVEETRAVIESV
jgi:creatinine amidohydrolase